MPRMTVPTAMTNEIPIVNARLSMMYRWVKTWM